MGNCVSVYGESKKEGYENNYFSAGLCSMRGARESMQDSYCICLSIPNHPFYSLFAVFDGFNGYSASQYLRDNLVSTLNELYSLSDDKLIIDAINKMDKTFLNSKDENININAGSTLVFALITNQFVTSSVSSPYSPSVPSSPSTITSSSLSSAAWERERESISSITTTSSLIQQKGSKVRIFWAGDSRALVIKKNNDFEQLTIDHHCSLPSEKKRICNPLSNGTIINGKIDGITELSRSFGCISMKNNKNLKQDEQKQICMAEYKHISCQSNDTLLLFSDGLLQKWSNKQVVKKYNFHYNQHVNYPNPMINSLNYFVEECIDDGSGDNMTVIAIKFK